MQTQPLTNDQPPQPRRAVVTGAAGFIGSHLCQALLTQGVTVIGVDRLDPDQNPRAAANLTGIRHEPGFLFVPADLRTCAIEPLLVEADVVYHLAGLPGVHPSWGPDFDQYVATNIGATQRLMDAVTKMRVPRLVVASSSSVYGVTDGHPSTEADPPRPASPYAITKVAQEQLCLAYSARTDCPTTVVALRYFTVYGPRQREDMFMQRLLIAAVTGIPLRLYGDGKQRRDFTYIHDAVTATIRAGTALLPSCVINVGGGSDTDLLEVVEHARALTNRQINLRTENARAGDVPATRADPSTARRLLGGAPATDLLTGMASQLHWLTSRNAASSWDKR